MPQRDFPFSSSLPSSSDFRTVNAAVETGDPEILAQMFEKTTDPNVLARIGENVRTPISVLERLAKSQGLFADFIKSYVIRNPVLPNRLVYAMLPVENDGLRNRIYSRLLDAFKLNMIELTGEEVHDMVKFMSPKAMNELDLLEKIETIHEERDQKRKTT